MEKSGERKWNTNVTSILWAHEIRREHIQLVNQIDSARADLSSTTDTLSTLNQTINELVHQVFQHASEHNNISNRLSQVEGQLEAIIERIKSLEAENVLLKGRLEAAERDNTTLHAHVGCKSMLQRPTINTWGREPAMAVAKQGSENGLFEDEVNKHDINNNMKNSKQNSGADILVPDSIPSLSRKTPNRILSSTTWGGSSDDLEGQYNDQTNQNNPMIGNEHTSHDSVSTDLCRTLVQDQLSLAEYLSHAERIWDDLSPDIKEDIGKDGRFVTMFLSGLRTPDFLKKTIEGRIECANSNCSWEEVVPIIKEIADREGDVYADQSLYCRQDVFVSPAAATIVATADESGIMPMPMPPSSSGGVDLVGRPVAIPANKKRRCIPIVPIDEEDEDALMAAYVSVPELP